MRKCTGESFYALVLCAWAFFAFGHWGKNKKKGSGGVLLFVCAVGRRWMLFLLDEGDDPKQEDCTDYCGEDLADDGCSE